MKAEHVKLLSYVQLLLQPKESLFYIMKRGQMSKSSSSRAF